MMAQTGSVYLTVCVTLERFVAVCRPLQAKSLCTYGRLVLNFPYTDKKESQIFLIYKEIQNGAVAKSYIINGLLIYGEIFAHFLY
jgi:hypothetical protein